MPGRRIGDLGISLAKRGRGSRKESDVPSHTLLILTYRTTSGTALRNAYPAKSNVAGPTPIVSVPCWSPPGGRSPHHLLKIFIGPIRTRGRRAPPDQP